MIRRLAFQADRCLACRSCELACVIAHSTGGDLLTALSEPYPPKRRVSVVMGREGPLALRCQQCDEPLCVLACKGGALYQDLFTGRIRFESQRCVSCAMCLMVCSRGVRPDPAHGHVVRCDACLESESPACVVACPTRALTVGEAEYEPALSDYAGRLVVVGSSAAGLAACEAARAHAPRSKIALVTADVNPLQSRPLLSYVLSRDVETDRLNWRPTDYLEKTLGVEVRAGARAVGLEPVNRRLRLENGQELDYDRIILAVGARAVALDVPGKDLPGVHTLRNPEDLSAITQRAEAGRRVVVVGGGNVGLQICEALLSRGLAVAVVVRSEQLLSQSVDSEAGRRVAELFRTHGLVLKTGREVRAIEGNGSVERVRLDDGALLQADLVVVGKGIVPNVEWLAGSGVEIGRGIRIDAQCRTSAPDVFAAGDCCESRDPQGGGLIVSGVWPVASEMGRVAGSTAVGVPRATAGALRLNAMRFFGTPIISIGEVREQRLSGATMRILARTQSVFRKLVLWNGRLGGALFYGDVTGAGAFYRLYREQALIEESALAQAERGVHP